MRTDSGAIQFHRYRAVAPFEGTISKQWGRHMRSFLKSFMGDESGAAAAEYALILAIVGAGVTVAMTDLGAAISSAFHTVQGYF